MNCPPVWGFIGLAKYIDVNHVAYTNRTGSDDDGDNDATIHGFADRKGQKKYLRDMLLQKSTGLADTVNSNECAATVV